MPIVAGRTAAVWVAAGGGLGSVLRYLVGEWASVAGPGMPFGTLVVNLGGSVVLGLVLGGLTRRPMTPEVAAGLTIGLCGGFTTFSTFGYETFVLLTAGAYGAAAAYVLASTLLCLIGFAGGYRVLRVR